MRSSRLPPIRENSRPPCAAIRDTRSRPPSSAKIAFRLPADALAQEAYTLFTSGQSAVAVMNGDLLEGIVTKSDLLEFWAHNRSGK